MEGKCMDFKEVQCKMRTRFIWFITGSSEAVLEHVSKSLGSKESKEFHDHASHYYIPHPQKAPDL
jgi:hypothetical protein